MHCQVPCCTFNIFNALSITFDSFRTLLLVFKFCGQRTFSSKLENRREWSFNMSKIYAVTFDRLRYATRAVTETEYTFNTPGALTTYQMCTLYSPLSTSFNQWEPGISVNQTLM